MGFSEKLSSCRAEIVKSIERRDPTAAKLSAVAYARLLREMATMVGSAGDKAALTKEAENAEIAAVLFASEGVTERAVALVLGKKLPSAKPAAPSSANGSERRSAEQPSPPTVAHGSGDEWVADTFEQYLPATVTVSTQTGAGTGFFISKDGLLLTNHHVAYNGSKKRADIWVQSGDGKIKSKAEIIAADQALDVALLRASSIGGKSPFIPLIKNYSDVRVGTEVVLIGNGLNYGLAPISGTVKFTSDKFAGDLVYTAPSNSGDSGSPVINRNGECIGIHKSKTTSHTVGTTEYGAVGLSNATGADNIHRLLDKWSKEYKL